MHVHVDIVSYLDYGRTQRLTTPFICQTRAKWTQRMSVNILIFKMCAGEPIVEGAALPTYLEVIRWTVSPETLISRSFIWGAQAPRRSRLMASAAHSGHAAILMARAASNAS